MFPERCHHDVSAIADLLVYIRKGGIIPSSYVCKFFAFKLCGREQLRAWNLWGNGGRKPCGLATVRGKVLKKKESHNSVDEILQFCVGISDLHTNTTFNHLFECSEKTQQSLPGGVV